MTLNMNQFAMQPVAGDTDLVKSGFAFSAQVASSVTTPLVPGQAVKVEDSAGGVPKVLALAANTDTAHGVVMRNNKDISYAALTSLEIASWGSTIWMTAGGAIARFGKVEVVAATSKVIASAGTNPVFGIAFDKAAADLDLIRVTLITFTL